ncbi:hypothetical protein [Actinomadura rudentiformis]|uniref:LapA family protein n=1 Tax=Actinomadura rudentiformis TaxID=359158 RepID=A0A6H9Z7P8_9ACTN|nr:hypothetical protein [Actinomadura rudentiformis]KAB2351028.1 hypothetical protein F8566_08790 [Actinomadura rudentiformis]
MMFLGLALAVAAIVVAAAVVMDNTGDAQISAFGDTVPGITSEWQVFLAGAVVAILFMAGMTIAAFGFNRSVRIRRELRDLREEHEESIHTLELEKRQLQRELARVRQAAAPNGADPGRSVPSSR